MDAIGGPKPMLDEVASRLLFFEKELKRDKDKKEHLRAIVSFISSITNTSSPSSRSSAPLSAGAADGLAATSEGSMQLRRFTDSCYNAADLGTQHWIGVGMRGGKPRRPTKALFVPATAEPPRPSAKPFDCGIYTSTPMSRGSSMWRAFLDPYSGSDLFPLPWRTWQLEAAGADVYSIDSAQSWVDLVSAFPFVKDDVVFPDWQQIAGRYDAVRFTLPGIVAIQGFRFTTLSGLTAPGYWDVESTFWLKWVFVSAQIVAD